MDKWGFFTITGIFLILALSMVYTDYTRRECRLEALKAGKSADDISKICK